ncbi:MAG: hypothetical protein LBG81_06200 [Coriobacteriaceae bacterium]|jgi:hypothetical protein|nr:hypothetical protein [Coriobacteriaceae bacterium]
MCITITEKSSHEGHTGKDNAPVCNRVFWASLAISLIMVTRYELYQLIRFPDPSPLTLVECSAPVICYIPVCIIGFLMRKLMPAVDRGTSRLLWLLLAFSTLGLPAFTLTAFLDYLTNHWKFA